MAERTDYALLLSSWFIVSLLFDEADYDLIGGLPGLLLLPRVPYAELVGLVPEEVAGNSAFGLTCCVNVSFCYYYTVFHLVLY